MVRRFSGTDRPAVDRVSLEVRSGEVVVIAGESGSGKTTLLRMVAGLERPDRGEIRIGDRVVFGPDRVVPPEERGVGMVFQDYALFPHLPVRRNVGFGLAGRPRAERDRRVDELVEHVGLGGLGHRYPHELSGGQQQRVALARALAPSPSLLLLDEPFSNLDSGLRDRMRSEVLRIIGAAGATALVVGPDRGDAAVLAERLVLLRAGRVEQTGTVAEVREAPATRYVADFFGGLG